jgi:molybdenum cofactor cytidylyltransferase
MKSNDGISVVIPAAGNSSRMGRSKLTLPWISTTIIGHIIETFSTSGLRDIIIVTNPNHLIIKDHLEYLSKTFPIHRIDNHEFEDENMLSSIQVGLKAVREPCKAALICLADQPQVQAETISQLIFVFNQNRPKIVVPSFNMHRGHPWLIPNRLFDEFLEIKSPLSARDFLKSNNSSIQYVEIDNDSILQDIDTPLEYQNSLPIS